MIPKEDRVRSEAYRRMVASLPCKICGNPEVQAAHPNANKAKGMKACDLLCFPLCVRHHGMWDTYQYGREEQRALEPVWAQETQDALILQANGKQRETLKRLGLIK